MEKEPIGRIGPQRQKIRRRTNGRELCTPKHLLWHQALVGRQVQFYRLDLVRQVRQHQNGVGLVMAHIGQDFAVVRAQEGRPTAAKYFVLLAQGNSALHPPQE